MMNGLKIKKKEKMVHINTNKCIVIGILLRNAKPIQITRDLLHLFFYDIT
jgi:hypothetical protein